MTLRQNRPHQATGHNIAKWCIWSIKNQTWLSGQLRAYVWGATAVVAFFTLTGLIRLETALWSLSLSGGVICATIWVLIRQRKVWLLNIRDSELRRQALAAMVHYLHEVNHEVPRHPFSRHTQENSSKGQAECPHCR